jgi:hypothetical protein
MKRIVVLGLLAPMLAGCFGQIDKDMLALVQSQTAISMKVAQYERHMMDTSKALVEQYFVMVERVLITAENTRWLDAHTGPDGKLYSSNAAGETVPISRADVETAQARLVAARQLMDAKRAEWVALCAQWDSVLVQLESTSNITLASMEDVNKAKESFQAILTGIMQALGEVLKVALPIVAGL